MRPSALEPTTSLESQLGMLQYRFEGDCLHAKERLEMPIRSAYSTRFYSILLDWNLVTRSD